VSCFGNGLKTSRNRRVVSDVILALLIGAVLIAPHAAPHAAADEPSPENHAPGANADAPGADGTAAPVVVIGLEGTLTAGTGQYIRESLEQAVEQNAGALLIRLDTPGGLVDATLDVIKDLLNAPIPVITYVHPSGGIAASAGTFVLLAGHAAAMSPGTTIGAAMPVMMQPGGGEQQEADDKTVRFLAGHITNIAETRGRPAEIAERFVTENLTLGAEQALEEGVIDQVAENIPALLEQLHGTHVTVAGQETELSTRDAELVELEMTTRQRIMNFISNPQVAFLLFMLGIYGIFFGLNMPGTFVPETLGVVALILALFGLGMFEVNALGAVLIVVAVVLFVLEAFTPTFGFFTAGGVAALIAGALLLPVEPMMPSEWFQTFLVTVLGMAVVTAGFFILVITKIVRIRSAPTMHDTLGMNGYEGVTVDGLAPVGTVKIRGEWWNARSASEQPIAPGTTVRVTGERGMELLVEPVADTTTADKYGGDT